MSLALKQARAGSQGGRSGVVQQGGFLGSVFGGLKKAVGVGLATLTGGPAGGAASLLSIRRGSPPPIGPTFAGPGAPGIKRQAQAFFPGGATGFEGLKLACQAGHHPNKSSYFLLDGGFVEKGTRCVKNRRRNPMNPRALDRAISRVDSGKSLQGKLASITTAKWTAAGQRKHPHG